MIFLKQNKKEFSKLIEQNQRIIHKITSIYATSYEDREDLFQEICLQLWKSYSNFKKESKFSTWVYRIGINTAISNLRKAKKDYPFEPLKATHLKVEPIDDDEKSKLLHTSISTLNRIDKAIILLWLEEKNYEEIASIMGITKTNVSVKLVRIKKKLEEIITKSEKQTL